MNEFDTFRSTEVDSNALLARVSAHKISALITFTASRWGTRTHFITLTERSTLMTSAPRSANKLVQCGPASTRVKSRTESPSSIGTVEAGELSIIRLLLPCWVRCNLNKTFAQVVAAHHADERRWSVLDAVDNIFRVHQFTATQPVGELRNDLIKVVHIIAYAESLDARFCPKYAGRVAQRVLVAAVVVLRNLPADGHAPAMPEPRQYSVQRCAAHVVEIDVDTIRAMFVQRSIEICLLVVERRIQSGVLTQMRNLVIRACGPDNSRAMYAGQLRGHLANGAAGGRYNAVSPGCGAPIIIIPT